MHIIIATGIYPPATSGPAQYAAGVEAELKKLGHTVGVLTYGAVERWLPAGVRHLWFAARLWGAVGAADFILALDTFSVGAPAVVVAKLRQKKIIIRTGGDFLYEQYVERTQADVLLTEFYTRPRRLSGKEKIIFAIMKWTLQNCHAVIFSTTWQRDIFFAPYQLSTQKIFIVANRFDKKLADAPWQKKNFIFATRNLRYKNIARWQTAFAAAQKINPAISLELYHDLPHAELLRRLATAYAAVMPALGEISPHFILDALRYNRPFILTRASGYAQLLAEVGVLVDPLSVTDMRDKILWLADEQNYHTIKQRVLRWDFTHSWEEITREILAIVATL